MQPRTSSPAERQWFAGFSLFGNDRFLLLRLSIIVLVGFLAVAPALDGGWLMDDDQQVTANYHLRTVEGLGRIWVAPLESDYYPVKSTISWGIWQIWGSNPVAFRLFSLSCHFLSALLTWRLLGRLGLKWAWLGGLLFVAHPLTLGSVAWISQIKNTVSLPFFLAALLIYLTYDETRKGRDLAGAMVFFLAAILSKSSVIMFPAVILLYGWWKRGTVSLRDLGAAVPFAVISGVFGCVTIWFQNTRSIGDYPIPDFGWLARVTGAGTNAWVYLEKFLVPVNLSPIYPQWTVDPPSIWQLLSVPAWAVVLGISWRKRDGWGRHVLLGLGFFLLNLLPVLGLQKMAFMAFTWVSDHFVYLPMIGLIGLVVAAVEALCGRMTRLGKIGVFAGVAIGIAGLTAISRSHAAVFRNDLAWWTRAVQRSPKSSPALNSLGAAYLGQKRLPEAFRQIEEALKIRPDFPEARNNLGLALMETGRHEEAMVQFREALRLKPWLASAHLNASTALLDQGSLDANGLREVFAHLEAALKLRPAYPVARNNLGRALMKAGHNEAAMVEFSRALALEPGLVAAHVNMGILFLQGGNSTEAEKCFQQAIVLDPKSAEACNGLAIALASQGRLDEAIEGFQRAVALDPSNDQARANLEMLRARRRDDVKEADGLRPSQK